MRPWGHLERHGFAALDAADACRPSTTKSASVSKPTNDCSPTNTTVAMGSSDFGGFLTTPLPLASIFSTSISASLRKWSSVNAERLPTNKFRQRRREIVLGGQLRSVDQDRHDPHVAFECRFDLESYVVVRIVESMRSAGVSCVQPVRANDCQKHVARGDGGRYLLREVRGPARSSRRP